MVLYIYAGTLFLSAFILFLVQPIIGKMILPKLGGTPQVWNTCMVFFQMVLLAGYAYTHTASTRLNPRRQLMIHAVLLMLPLIILFMFRHPFDVEWWNAPPGSNPIPSTLLVLVTIVGLPFFIVSTSAPLLQRWFVYTGHPAAKDPYFLYGASNLGSLLALVIYPFLIEPYFTRAEQAWIWAVMYIVFVLFVLYSAYTVWEPTGRLALATGAGTVTPSTSEAPASTQGSTAITASAPSSQPKETAFKKGPTSKSVVTSGLEPGRDTDVDTISGWRRARWIALAAVPSSLMLGVTTHVTTDKSPDPVFWLIPLMLYLLSFILVFAKWPVVWVEKPHNVVLFLQVPAIALMLFVDWRSSTAGIDWRIEAFFQALAFFMTALMCHGELARDRPSVRHLTEFYLMMSVGGMLGGMFNGIIAPVIPIPYVWEFSLAVICACLFRPEMKESGWTDDVVAGMTDQQQRPTLTPAAAKGKGKPQPVAVSVARPSATPKLARTMDVVLPVALCALMLVFSLLFARTAFPTTRSDEASPATREFYAFLLLGVPLIIACFYYTRPLRVGLAVAAIILFHGMLVGDSFLHGDRSYFGIIRVRQLPGEGVDKPGTYYLSLMHGNIDHGMNFRKPGLERVPTREELESGELRNSDWGKKDKDFSRLASTYYHRYGPVGVIMERWNWGSGYWQWDQNTYYADLRMPAGIVGLSLSPDPLNGLTHAWSEPPLATIGLGTGTMASYARPYQSIHFYEIDNHVKKLSLPEGPKGKVYFTYLMDAQARGADVQVYMGDAFQRMRLEYYNVNDPKAAEGKKAVPGGPDGYYKMMVVDAFSSDAIPTHLLTKEAFTMYFQKLAPDGILCVHTSNRYVELPKVVVDVANDLGFIARRGHDNSPFKQGRTEHYTSEWVMVARKSEYLQPYLAIEPRVGDKTYTKAMQEYNRRQEKKGYGPSSVAYWDDPPATGRYIWTLDHSSLWQVLRSNRRSSDE